MISWRSHPKLKGKLLAQDSDELQIIAHDGGPALTNRRPELVSVRVTDFDGVVFVGRVLHQPIQLRTIQLGQQIRFIIPDGSVHPVLVTEKYLLERSRWTIDPCQKCGFSELFDPPSDLIRASSPGFCSSSDIQSFESACPRCGGPIRIHSNNTSPGAVRTGI